MAFTVADYKVNDQVRVSQAGTVTGFRPTNDGLGYGYDGIFVRVAEGERTLEANSGWEVELIDRPFVAPNAGSVVKFAGGGLGLSYGDEGYIALTCVGQPIRPAYLSDPIMWCWQGVEDEIEEVFS